MIPKTIETYIEERREWLVETTARFIRTPSISGSEGAVARVLTECLEGCGMNTITDKAGNVVASWGKEDKPTALAFNVHLDTVPPGSLESWKYAAFGGIVEGGRIFGRGASDTKGAWAPIMLAMEAVKASAIPLEGKALFTAVVMEELGLCTGMRVLLESTLRDSLPHRIILGEPTDLGIAVGHKGKCELAVTTHGKACHASIPWAGQNALYLAAPVISSLEKVALNLESGPEDLLFGRPTLALTDITCNPGVRNIIPDSCTMYADCRFPPGETPSSVKERVERYLSEGNVGAAVRISGEDGMTYTGLPVRGEKYIPAFGLAEDHPLVTTARQAVAATLGKEPRVYRWNFATDGGFAADTLGIPTIGFSPCEERLAHTVDEYVSIDAMVDAAKVYAAMIILLAGKKGA